MNFGNFFRNISTDRTSGGRVGATGGGSAAEGVGGATGVAGGGDGGGSGSGSGSGGSIFATPSRLFESINAKTGSIVSDFSHKVDLANKLDTIKKYSPIDKIGQSVLGTSFQARASTQPHNDANKVPLQTPHNLHDSYPLPPQHTQQQHQHHQQQQQQQQLHQQRQQLSQGQEARQNYRSEQSEVWSADYSSTPTDTAFDPHGLHVLPRHPNQPPATTSYEYHPEGGYSIRKQDTHQLPQSHPPTEASEEGYRPPETRQATVYTSTEREATQPLWQSQTSEVLSIESESLTESSRGGAEAQANAVSAWQSDAQFGGSQGRQLSSGECGEERRHENPFNKGMSVDTSASRQEAGGSFRRQNTTPGFRPPRPPPPRSRSRSGSTSEATSVSGSQSLLVENARRMSLTEEVSTKQASPLLHSLTSSPLFEEADETLKDAASPPSSEEIGYLTRLQCQQIVSAVDDMIAHTMEASETYESVTRTPSYGVEFQSHNYWHDTSHREAEVSEAQAVEDGTCEVNTYYVTEPEETTSSTTPHTTADTQSAYLPSYVAHDVQEEEEKEEDEEAEAAMAMAVKRGERGTTQLRMGEDVNAHDYAIEYGVGGEEKREEEGKAKEEEAEVKVVDGKGRSASISDDWYTSQASERHDFTDEEEVEEEEEEEEERAEGVGRGMQGKSTVSHDADWRSRVEATEDSLKPFITKYVQQLVTGNEAELETSNDAFKEHMLTPQGRELFSKAVELQGAYSGGRLDENGLRAMLSRVIFVLTECHKSEDFVPAKRLLTTSLVYHIEDPTKVGEKVFLFSYIKSQPIWHSLRFWNACFFQSVQETRAKMMDQMRSDAEIDQAILGQIRSYLNTMHVFNLHATMRHEFLRKQGDLFNLPQDDVEALSTLIDNPQTN